MGTASTVLILNLLSVWVEIILLKAIELVVLQEDGLLYHGLIGLCEEVVFLDVVLIWGHHFGQITLQEASLAILLGLLRTSRRLL